MNLTRRKFLQTTSILTAGLPLADIKILGAGTDLTTAGPRKSQTKIEFFPVTHGGRKPTHHERLDTTVNAQTAVVTLRFYRPVRVDRVEIPPTVYGRSAPAVPTHPAHLIVSVFNRSAARWDVIRELDLPANPKFSGRGLTPRTPMKEMEKFFEDALKEAPPYVVDLGGLETDHLRLECDREHPVWANSGEMNGNVYSVPFGIFREVSVFGEPLGERPAVAPYNPILQHGEINPAAPAGMVVTMGPSMILFRGPRLSVGFSLYRPMLLHLGWDDLGDGRADLNRLLVTRSIVFTDMRIVHIAGLTGPVLRTLDYDIGSHLWTGRLEASGSEVRYLGLQATKDLQLNVVFTVEADRMRVSVEEICSQPFTAVEYEAWRFAWDARRSPTGTNGVPSERPGRNGHVPLPVYFSGDGSGCLSLRRTDSGAGSGDGTHLQAESYRICETCTSGIVLDERAKDGFGVAVREGTRKASFELAVTNFQPRRSATSSKEPAPNGIRRSWATLVLCYRPEFNGFSNNCISNNCHLGQWSEIEVLAHSEQPANGPDLSGMMRFTMERAVLDGGGYGYWREYFMDSDPSLLCGAGGCYRMNPKKDWLERIRPGLVEIFERMAVTSDEKSGLLVNKDLSGNTWAFNRSTNGVDTVSFGHLDAYSNAWAYRGLRNVAFLFKELGDGPRAERATGIADKMRVSYGPTFINPETGWVSGWRSQDDKLHDYGYLYINGMAIAFGLLDASDARKALSGLEEMRRKVCPVSAQLGLPANLIPHAYGDFFLPQVLKNGSQPTFEIFNDGGLSSNTVVYYLRSLSEYGFKKEARFLAEEFDKGFAAGAFSGGVGSGNELRSWEGLPTGYEGTLTYNYGLVYAIAVEKGLVQPLDPEWWPA
jgi:hypothetical protein